MTVLSELMRNAVTGNGRFEVAVGADWMQGRSVFGGLQAAIALRAMRTLVAPDVPLRTLQFTFIEPIGEGAVSASASVLRTGKSATHVEARLGAAGAPQAVAIGVFGTSRESIVRRDVAPSAPAPVLSKLPYLPGILPSFLQHFDVNLLAGAAPFSGQPVDRVVYDVSLRDAGPASESHLLAFADFVPPVALSWMPRPVPGTSLTWMLELLDADFATQPLEHWRIDASLVAARDGYTSQTTTIHAPNGVAIALTRQSMLVFA